ncbi:MAG: fused protease/ribonucleoside-triphosphate reductase, partial [Candidatus Bathyarchaeota archaeon]|nr:fused protease/ribonucleoside-triphosphate reductase [Candidatus Bathyarchaeota archaeon]
MNDFKLSDAFISKHKGKQPDWGPLGYITYKRTYARPLCNKCSSYKLDATEDNEWFCSECGSKNTRTEEYWETCKRVVEGTYNIQKWHCEKHHLPWQGNKAQRSAQEMYTLMWEFKFLPPGRGLWMMGTEFIWKKGGAALNNCSFISTKELNLDFADPFCFLMDMSMLGVGVGGDTKGAGLVTIRAPRQGDYTYVVEDSREGWVELVRTILNAYAGKGSLPKTVDYSKLRPYGAPIKGFGGTSSGPEPLRSLAETDIPAILDPLEDEEVTSEAIVDIFNAIGKCVVSGNVRRSAEIMFGDPDDEAFLDLKLNKKMANKWRWASNNSVLATIGMDYSDVATRTAINGEPGYLWLDTARKYGRLSDGINNLDSLAEGCNPCSEQTLESYELCCLVETFPGRHATYEDYERTLKFAYLYAKTVTLLPTHNERTNAVMLRNRRIGTSQSGIAQSM